MCTSHQLLSVWATWSTCGSSPSSSAGFIHVYFASPSFILSPLNVPSNVDPPEYVTLAFPGRGSQFEICCWEINEVFLFACAKRASIPCVYLKCRKFCLRNFSFLQVVYGFRPEDRTYSWNRANVRSDAFSTLLLVIDYHNRRLVGHSFSSREPVGSQRHLRQNSWIKIVLTES